MREDTKQKANQRIKEFLRKVPAYKSEIPGKPQ
jgi:hypothetical protein